VVILRQVVGPALRDARKQRGWTLREVSSRAQVSLGYLSEVERGHKEPSSELLAAICMALGVRLSDLFKKVASDVAQLESAPGQAIVLPVHNEALTSVNSDKTAAA
jgi:transcriptional regulator with XRE-family HTH domain